MSRLPPAGRASSSRCWGQASVVGLRACAAPHGEHARAAGRVQELQAADGLDQRCLLRRREVWWGLGIHRAEGTNRCFRHRRDPGSEVADERLIYHIADYFAPGVEGAEGLAGGGTCVLVV